jgi:murein DD-endopeptidase MepM/ murein hydrolase activator NlpD
VETQYNFKRHHSFHIPNSYQSSDFDRWRIDIYPYDIDEFNDTLSFTLRDQMGYNLFTFPVKGHVTSGFGPRNLFGRNYHHGTDIRLNQGDEVVAALEGIVRLVRRDPGGYGKFVVISHKDGLETLYGHLSKQLVRKGQHVNSGDVIGLGGSTGSSTGDHLHFEFRFMGVQFDPEEIISFNDTTLKVNTIRVQKELFQYKFGDEHAARARTAHRVKRGDTLYGIARRYGTTVQQLCRINDITETIVLRPGQRLKVPEGR